MEKTIKTEYKGGIEMERWKTKYYAEGREEIT